MVLLFTFVCVCWTASTILWTTVNMLMNLHSVKAGYCEGTYILPSDSFHEAQTHSTLSHIEHRSWVGGAGTGAGARRYRSVQNVENFDFAASNTYCKDLYGTGLAQIDTEAQLEAAAVLCELTEPNLGCYIGLNDDGFMKEGEFSWLFDVPVTDFGFTDADPTLPTVGVCPWAPNALQQRGDCVLLERQTTDDANSNAGSNAPFLFNNVQCNDGCGINILCAMSATDAPTTTDTRNPSVMPSALPTTTEDGTHTQTQTSETDAAAVAVGRFSYPTDMEGNVLLLLKEAQHANQYCMDEFDTHLGSVLSAQDLDNAFQLCRMMNTAADPASTTEFRSCFIGMHDDGHLDGEWIEGQYQWMDGSVTDYGFICKDNSRPLLSGTSMSMRGTGSGAGYGSGSPWDIGEPDNSNTLSESNADCVAVNANGKLADVSCDLTGYFLCNSHAFEWEYDLVGIHGFNQWQANAYCARNYLEGKLPCVENAVQLAYIAAKVNAGEEEEDGRQYLYARIGVTDVVCDDTGDSNPFLVDTFGQSGLTTTVGNVLIGVGGEWLTVPETNSNFAFVCEGASQYSNAFATNAWSLDIYSSTTMNSKNSALFRKFGATAFMIRKRRNHAYVAGVKDTYESVNVMPTPARGFMVAILDEANGDVYYTNTYTDSGDTGTSTMADFLSLLSDYQSVVPAGVIPAEILSTNRVVFVIAVSGSTAADLVHGSTASLALRDALMAFQSASASAVCADSGELLAMQPFLYVFAPAASYHPYWQFCDRAQPNEDSIFKHVMFTGVINSDGDGSASVSAAAVAPVIVNDANAQERKHQMNNHNPNRYRRSTVKKEREKDDQRKINRGKLLAIGFALGLCVGVGGCLLWFLIGIYCCGSWCGHCDAHLCNIYFLSDTKKIKKKDMDQNDDTNCHEYEYNTYGYISSSANSAGNSDP